MPQGIRIVDWKATTRSWWNGIHTCLKNKRDYAHVGSIPTGRTIRRNKLDLRGHEPIEFENELRKDLHMKQKFDENKQVLTTTDSLTTLIGILAGVTLIGVGAIYFMYKRKVKDNDLQRISTNTELGH